MGYVEEKNPDTLINYALLLADWYVEQIKGRRADIKFTFKHYGDLKDIGTDEGKTIIMTRFREIVDNNFLNIPIYMPFYAQFYDLLKDQYLLIPERPFYRVVEKEASYDKIYKLINRGNKRFITRYISDKKVFRDDKVMATIIEKGYVATYVNRGAF